MTEPHSHHASRDVFGRDGFGWRGLLISRNIARFALATLLCAATLGQATSASAQTTEANGIGAERLPDAADVAAAFERARAWVTAFQAPLPDDPAAKMHLGGASGACAVIRHNGRVLGIGGDWAGDDLMLHRAVAKALGEAMLDPVIEGMPGDAKQLIGRAVTLEVEIAGRLTPLVGRSIQQLAAKIEPGLDGIALRRDRQTWVLFPAQQRASNTADDPTGRLLGLAVKAGLALKELSELGERPDVSVYRFSTVHLAQLAADQPPFATLRGDQIVPQASIDAQSIRVFADGLATHLIASMWPEPPIQPAGRQAEVQAAGAGGDPKAERGDPLPEGPVPTRRPLGLMGDYQIVSDIYRPMLAPPLEQALAAFALLRYAEVSDAGAAAIDRARSAASRILKDLDVVIEGEDDPRNDPAAAAAIVYAISADEAMVEDAVIRQLFVTSAEIILESFNAAKSTFEWLDANDRRLDFDPHEQALLAGAMCRLLNMKSAELIAFPPRDPKVIRSAVDQAWQSVPPPQRIALLPWIGWAETDFALATQQPLARVEDLRQLRDALDRSRIMADDRISTPDLHGGFVFTSGHPAVDDEVALGRVDAQSARPAAWLASILRKSELTPADRELDHLARHMQTMRFLVQLSVREPLRYTLRTPAAAMGGIRASTWNNQQPAAAQALALMAAAETLASLERPTTLPDRQP